MGEPTPGRRLIHVADSGTSVSTNTTSSPNPDADIAALEAEIAELTAKLNAARRAASGPEVPDYAFRTLDGEVRLRELFAGHDRLLAIHNMG